MSKNIFVIEATIRGADQWVAYFADGTFYASFTRAGARAEMDKLKQLVVNNLLQFRIANYARVETLAKGVAKHDNGTQDNRAGTDRTNRTETHITVQPTPDFDDTQA